ncbi:MAG: asparagine synthase-related protein [Polyangiaceae bacterium]
MSLLYAEAFGSTSEPPILATLGARADRVDRHQSPSFACVVFARWIAPEQLDRSAIAEGARWIVAVDGRLDERDALAHRVDLSADGSTDAALVAALLDRRGLSALEALTGDFALIAFEPARRTVVLMRDPLGVRPLFYARGGSLRVSSDERALRRSGLGGVDPGAIAAALAGALVTRERTLFRDVRSVPAGSILVFDGPDAVPLARTYFEPDPHAADAHRPDREHLERVRNALEHAVEFRTQSPHPIAAQASGGLDSSSVVVLASAALAKRGRSLDALLHMRATGLDCDELRYATALRESLPSIDGVSPELLVADGAEVVFDPVAAARADLDFPGPWCVAYRELYERAVARGVRVVLTGEGSDELATHLGFEVDDALQRHAWLEAARFANLYDSPFDRASWVALARAFVRALSPAAVGVRRAHQRLARSLPRFMSAQGRDDATAAQLEIEHFSERFDHPSPLRRAACLALAFSPSMSWIMTSHQRFAADAGVEQAHPFLDVRVARAFLALPTHLRWSPEMIKPALRQVIGPALRPGLRWRSPPAEYSAFHARAFHRTAASWEPLASNSRLAELGVVDPTEFTRMVRATFAPQTPPADMDFTVLRALTLEATLRRLER